MLKVVISHLGALNHKYGDRLPEVLTAVQDLTKADATRGLQTDFVCIDQDIMHDLGGSPSSRGGLCDIRDSAAQRDAKEAVDLIVASRAPDYIAILDGPDVIPHVTLDNPVTETLDKTVDSDLPYASNAGYSRNVLDYLSVTRAVARIANARGTADPDPVIRLLGTAAKFESRPASDYRSYFALSAPEFAPSTTKSIRAIFNKDEDLDVVPPADSSNAGARFSRLHFINCHGLPSTPKFYGGQGSSEAATVAMTSEQVAAQAVEEVLVVSECCYGAHLYDPKEAQGIGPICISYLASGAIGFLGSTNKVYGGFDKDKASVPYGKGDLLASFFLKKILAGASLGGSLAEARQDFIRTQSMCDGTNLKTLAQFMLFGDPSTVPCRPLRTEMRYVAQKSLAKEGQVRTEMRYVAQKSLAKEGQAIAQAAIVPSGPGTIPEALKEKVRAAAIDRGYEIVDEDISKCTGWAGGQSGATDTPEFVMTVSAEAEPVIIGDGKIGNRSRYIIAYIAKDEIMHIEEAATRTSLSVYRAERCSDC